MSPDAGYWRAASAPNIYPPRPTVCMASARRQRGSRLAAEERRPLNAQALRTTLRGPVVTPEGSDYHETRKYGLTIDNLLSVDMVLADGSFVTASADANKDLFWAVRGGGGNFGVVTSFTFTLHPAGIVIAGPTFWPIAQAEEVLKWYREVIPDAPEELNGFFALLPVPPVAPFPQDRGCSQVASVVWCYLGSQEKADRLLAPARKVGKMAMYGLGPVPYPALQSTFDGLYPPGPRWYWRGAFVKEINDKAVEQNVKNANKLP